MKFNPKNSIYKVIAIAKDKKIYDVTGAVIHLNWDDSDGELARKCMLDLVNAKIEKNKWLTSILDENTRVILYADVGEGPKEILKSTCWIWDYVSGDSKELSLVLYEDSFYLTRSEGNFFKPKGKQTKEIVEEICKKAGIKVKYEYESIKHQAIKFRAKKYSDMISELLKEVEKEKKDKCQLVIEDDTFVIRKRGKSNKYILTVNNTSIVKHKKDKSNMVTKVVITSSPSKADKEPGVIKEITGNTEKYGTIQKIITKAKKDKENEAGKEADQVLKDQGKPEETISVENAPDYPFLRKGEKINLRAGNQIGEYYILSCSHYADKKTMNIELEKV